MAMARMRNSTIEKRIRRTVLGAILITFLVTVASVLTANDRLEQSLLDMDMQAERDFLLDNARPNEILVWDIATLKAYYVPAGMQQDGRMPELFQGLPFPFSGEIKLGAHTYLITTGPIRDGRLFLAKDITLFETREQEFHRFLLILGLAVVALGIMLSRITGKKLVAPVQQLVAQIRSTTPARRMPRVYADYQDTELRAIAQSFNVFLSELENYVKREQSLMGLASHELRTPIAVIAGALDVIERRGGLESADRAPLLRMRRAVNEMAANIDVLLRLTRRTSSQDRHEPISLAAVLREIQDDLARQLPDARQRLILDIQAQPQVHGDPVLVKILLRNLMQNSLQHTQGPVQATLTDTHADIVDHGAGLPDAYRNYLNDPTPDASELLSLSGLGLFIVGLICERLNWRLHAFAPTPNDNIVRIHFVCPISTSPHTLQTVEP
ncbi:sensor histidine kinase [Alcaligenes sp. SDU_A2]|uniref:sensor histidine kinase n=1 Tax=Alcaligenes sp. SDU_A2 TaxID=3136634 RepID=UPI00311D3643